MSLSLGNDPSALRVIASWWARLAAGEPDHPMTTRRLGLAAYFEDLARDQETGARFSAA